MPIDLLVSFPYKDFALIPVEEPGEVVAEIQTLNDKYSVTAENAELIIKKLQEILEAKKPSRAQTKDKYEEVVSYNTSAGTKERVFQACLQWFLKYGTFGDCIEQSDDAIIAAPGLLADLADHVFVFKSEEDLKHEPE